MLRASALNDASQESARLLHPGNAVLRRAIQENLVSFPSQIPAFSRQARPEMQWKAVLLYFVRGWPLCDIAARFGVGSHRISKVVDEWATRAIALGYIQVIDPERFEAWIGSEAKAEAGRLGAEERGTPSLEVSRSRLRRVSESVMSGSDRGRRSYGFLQPANAALIAALARAIRGCEGRGSQFFGQAAALLRDLRTAVEGSDGPRPTPPASWASDFNRPSPAPPVPAEEVLYAFNS
jgi:hypothetical protein